MIEIWKWIRGSSNLCRLILPDFHHSSIAHRPPSYKGNVAWPDLGPSCGSSCWGCLGLVGRGGENGHSVTLTLTCQMLWGIEAWLGSWSSSAIASHRAQWKDGIKNACMFRKMTIVTRLPNVWNLFDQSLAIMVAVFMCLLGTNRRYCSCAISLAILLVDCLALCFAIILLGPCARLSL